MVAGFPIGWLYSIGIQNFVLFLQKFKGLQETKEANRKCRIHSSTLSYTTSFRCRAERLRTVSSQWVGSKKLNDRYAFWHFYQWTLVNGPLLQKMLTIATAFWIGRRTPWTTACRVGASWFLNVWDQILHMVLLGKNRWKIDQDPYKALAQASGEIKSWSPPSDLPTSVNYEVYFHFFRPIRHLYQRC